MVEFNVFVSTNLIDMYIKCGSKEDACKIFNKMFGHDFWPCQTQRNVKGIGVVLAYTRSGAEFYQFCGSPKCMWRFISNQRKQGCSSTNNFNWL